MRLAELTTGELQWLENLASENEWDEVGHMLRETLQSRTIRGDPEAAEGGRP